MLDLWYHTQYSACRGDCPSLSILPHSSCGTCTCSYLSAMPSPLCHRSSHTPCSCMLPLTPPPPHTIYTTHTHSNVQGWPLPRTHAIRTAVRMYNNYPGTLFRLLSLYVHVGDVTEYEECSGEGLGCWRQHRHLVFLHVHGCPAYREDGTPSQDHLCWEDGCMYTLLWACYVAILQHWDRHTHTSKKPALLVLTTSSSAFSAILTLKM